MRTPERTPWSLLWFTGSVLLAAGYTSTQDEAPLLPTKGLRFLTLALCSEDEGSGGLRCPHRNKSVTLVPSFTKTTPTTSPHSTTTHRPVTNHTTPRHTTVHPQKHTTSHHHHHRTTSAHHRNHTTQHPTTTHRPRPTTSPHHNTTAHTTQRQTTVHPHNQTTSHQPRPTPSPHHNTTAHPRNHTTAPRPHTTAHSNRTTAPAVLTTLHHSTLTPHPTLMPSVLVGDYVVRNKTDICLRAEMGLQMRVRYTGKAKQQVWGDFALQPNQTNASGSCLDKDAILNLHFPEGFLSFFFTKNETQNTYYLSQIQANLTYQFPEATERSFGAGNDSLHEFEVHLGHSYQCRNRSLALSEGFRLNVLRERIQAFGLPAGKFGEAEVCPEQRRSNTLPIVVGVILGLLILIVIVAFLVGRRRKHSGYQTL